MQTKSKAAITLASKGKTLPASTAHANRKLLVDIDAISVRYGTDTVLDNISLCMHAGEFIGVIGPNGAGKTTLLKVLLGLRNPSRGAIAWQPDIVVGYVPQRVGANGSQVPLSVFELVQLGSRGDAKRTHSVLGEARMESFAAMRFDELSGGQQQRVYIAKALATNPDILILDEPTTGIDDQSQTELYNLLARLQAQGITIVMVSHDVDLVLTQVSRVVCLNRQVVFDGSPDAFEAEVYLPNFYAAQHRVLHHAHPGQHA